MKVKSIKSKLAITGLLKYGKRFKGSKLRIIYIESRNKHHSYVLLVSKKKLKRATDRNLVKRRLREGLRATFFDEFIRTVEVAIFLENKLEIVSYEDIKNDLIALKRHIVDNNDK